MKTSLARIALAIATSIASLSAAAPAAAEPVGRVLMAVGEVVANRAGRAVPLGNASAIESGDQIRTGPSSSVQIRFNDSSIIALKPQTVFSIDEFTYSGRSDGNERAFFNLIAGGMRTVTGLIGKLNQRNYAVKTPTATIGIRGSGFNLAACTAAAPCTGSDGVRARDGTYGQVFDLRIFSQTNAGMQDWQKGDVFLIPDANSLGERLREVPAFLAHTLVERSRNAGRSGGASEGASGAATADAAGDGRATQGPIPPAPLTFASTETRGSGGGVSVLGAGGVTGFIALYNLGSTSFDSVSDCGKPPCFADEVTNPVYSGSVLASYTTSTGPATLNATGASATGLQSLDLGGSMIGVYRLVGPISGTTVSGAPFSGPAAFLVGYTNDPAVGSGGALPGAGSFSFGGAGNSIGIMADSAGNAGTFTMSGSYNAVSRVVAMSASGGFASVGSFGPASLSFSGSAVIPSFNNEAKGAPVGFTCTGAGCQLASGTGLADLGFLRTSSGIKAMVVNGGLFNATKPGNVVLFIGAGKCVSGPC